MLTLRLSISHRSKLLVDSLSQHIEIVTHAPNALRAILGINLAPHFTAQDLSSALRAQECHWCGSFGPYPYLPECHRCCLPCLAEASDTHPFKKGLQRFFFLGSLLTHYGSSRTNKAFRMTQPRSLSSRYTYPEGRFRRYEGSKRSGNKLHESEEAIEAQYFLARAF